MIILSLMLMCSWNGTNYQPARRVDGVMIGKAGHGFAAFENCGDAVAAARTTVCNWNGTNYQPYAILRNQPVGQDGFGFAKLEDCRRSTRASENGRACNWTGQGYTAYDVSTGNPVGAVQNSLDRCIARQGDQ